MKQDGFGVIGIGGAEKDATCLAGVLDVYIPLREKGFVKNVQKK